MKSKVHLEEGDCRETLQNMIDWDITVDSVVTDPPYGLTSIVKRFGSKAAAPAKDTCNDGSFSRLTKGFMGNAWDNSGIERDPTFWKQVLDVLKPGAYVLAFSSPRTGHRQACAMEDAGFIMHPFFGWLYGTGFPKFKKVDKQLIKSTGDIISSKKWVGWAYGAQSMSPAMEPIYFAQKPFAIKNGAVNIRKYDTGGVNIDGCRVPGSGRHPSNVLHDRSDSVTGCVSNSEFFNSFPIYHPKANKDDRAGSQHPTVKPVGLIRWLCRLITPPGGTVLDPFAGTGTTGQAALDENMSAILLEAQPDYCNDIRRRFKLESES